MKTAFLASVLAMLLFGLQSKTEQKPVPLKIDAAAPSFRLNDHKGQTVAIGGQQDHWTVLAFYPKAMTPG
jgi:hypothetical protein